MPVEITIQHQAQRHPERSDARARCYIAWPVHAEIHTRERYDAREQEEKEARKPNPSLLSSCDKEPRGHSSI